MNGALRLGRLTGLAMLTLIVPAGAADQAGAIVEPIIEIKSGTVATCGVRARFPAGPAISFALERHGPGAQFVIRYAGADGKADAFRLDVDPQVMPDLSPGPRTEVGIELRAPATDPNVAVFMQSMMLQGITVATGKNFEQKLEIKGPLAQSVRAAYLNCAGDLYRPGE